MNSIKTIISLNCAAFMFMLGVGLVTPMLPGKIYYLSHSPILVGTLAAAFALTYVLVQIPMGILADRHGYKHFIIVGYILCGLSGLLYQSENSASAIIIGRAIQGFGEAPLWALPVAMISLLNLNKKSRNIGWYNASIHFGLTVGAIVGFISNIYISDKTIYQVYVLTCFLSAFLVLLGIKEKDIKPIKNNQSRDNRICKRSSFIFAPNVFWVLLGIIIYGMGYGVFITIVPNYISLLEPWHQNNTGMSFIMFYIGITAAQLVGGPLSDRIGRSLPMIVGLVLYSIGIIIFSHCQHFLMFVVLSLASFGLGIFLVGSIAYLNDLAGYRYKGFLSGLYYFFWGTGYFLGPVILGFMSKIGLIGYGFKSLGIVGLAISVSIILACRKSLVRPEPKYEISSI